MIAKQDWKRWIQMLLENSICESPLKIEKLIFKYNQIKIFHFLLNKVNFQWFWLGHAESIRFKAGHGGVQHNALWKYVNNVNSAEKNELIITLLNI